MADENGNSEAQIGWGSEFWLANAAGVLTELGEVTGLPFADEVADDVEVTHFKSPGRRKEYKAGLIEPGDATLELNYLPGSATDVLLREAHKDGKIRSYRTLIPAAEEGEMWQIDGFLYVKSRPRTVPIGDRMTMQVNVKFTGAVSEAEAVPAGA